MTRELKIKTIITAITGDRVIVTSSELEHALSKHYSLLPQDMFLELLERVLKDPTELYLDDSGDEKKYYMFYKLENEKYIVAVIKAIADGSYFSSMYPTGKKIRNAHKNLKRLKI